MNILELFAGVGGFRIGLENANPYLFETKWANQWEPSRKSQDAFEVYDYRFPNSRNLNISISDISDETFSEMDADMIVGGFPCQDYSVARSRKNEQGIEGKKGVLFWEIIRAARIIKPKYLILENVDRLLKAPSKQRGRDFAVMLAAFNRLGYSVEWRVINAAEYGRAQRRRRVFFFIYRNDTDFALQTDRLFESEDSLPQESRYDGYIFKGGLFAAQFPIRQTPLKNRRAYCKLSEDMVEISDNFSGVFWNAGIMRHGQCYSVETEADYGEKPITLGEIVQPESDVPEKYFLTDTAKLEKFRYLRGAKKIERVSSDGHTYIYSEGGMPPYDDLNLPGRTMLTSEGTVNRSTHLLKINGKHRLLTPVEAERLQDFPDGWTARKKLADGTVAEVSDKMRMFFMGNALVTEIVRKIGTFISEIETRTDC
ncbi:TPA: DNA (cytosine-5-)-methyltransferase [Neisseria meningitidis]|uniref:DNA (cytosine-5-)-methyltransferase n=1 Tax=Neisseria meningitidis TaxID=487 RepID=UPI000BB6688B|nr:DNA (cytosine-5-)-methyltransferase [Neisseria meningitidis]MBW3879958.1 DNA (cytosine-5-)-methyltransferase [Neisseria meningitidis]MBW4005071.1 DNA (cytosine-5-)-methyltransferase [Neisseria meningitidis]MCL5824335.1 DNA (cytosine-5-)-methyltransferase [Neisseria meningitidis]RPB96665.1 DNA (cytosine-5-)-methyltransferase [Neisseria meningitidis]